VEKSPDTFFLSPLGMAWTKLGRNLTGLAVKEMPAADGTKWTSVFTTSPGLPAAFWRNCARHSGTHIWCDEDEQVMADSSLVALHSVVGGPKTLHLPSASTVTDVITGETVAESARDIRFDMIAPDTRVFRIEPRR
jgi:hypothetical protein